MKELRRLILEEQQKAQQKTVPAAFVTFRHATLGSLGCESRLALQQDLLNLPYHQRHAKVPLLGGTDATYPCLRFISEVYAQEARLASEGREQHAAPRHQYMESHGCARPAGNYLGQPQVLTCTRALEVPISEEELEYASVRQLHKASNGSA